MVEILFLKNVQIQSENLTAMLKQNDDDIKVNNNVNR